MIGFCIDYDIGTSVAATPLLVLEAAVGALVVLSVDCGAGVGHEWHLVGGSSVGVVRAAGACWLC
jgi:hypothetical protein